MKPDAPMTLSEIMSLIAGIAALAAAVFAYLAWRVNDIQMKVMMPYLDIKSLADGGRLRLQGLNSEQWQIISVRLIWPLSEHFYTNEYEYDPGGSIVKFTPAPLGRNIHDMPEFLLVSGARTSLLLFKIALKSSPSTSKYRLVRQSKKP